MSYLKVILSLIISAVLCAPLVVVICQGEERKQELAQTQEKVVEVNFENACTDGNLDKCLLARDASLRDKNYVAAFKYLSYLCERFKDSKSCLLTYQTFFSMQQGNVKETRGANKITLYEVLYYLDLGCKLNNYDACMVAAKIYENGVKPGSSQALYGYNINYDPQEARRYYKKVCESVSDKASEACQKIVELREGPKTQLQMVTE